MPAAVIFAKTNASGSWQPDRRLRLTLAALATVLASLGFLRLLHQQAPLIAPGMPLTLSLQPAAPPHRNSVKLSTPVVRSGSMQPVTPIAVPSVSLTPLAPDWQAEVEAAVDAEGGGSIHAPSHADTQALQRALQTLPPPDTLQDGEAYRNAYGGTILKSGSACGEARTVATGPAPQDKTVVTAPIACPGEHKPTLGEQLVGWAQKMQQKLLRPPR